MSKKEQSNLADLSPRRFTLPKSHILRGRQNFKKLFTSSAFIHTLSLTLRYSLYPSKNEGFKIGFICPKKIGNAVKRNRCKRLMKESYRLNKHLLADAVDGYSGGLHAVLIAKHVLLDYKSVETDMVTLLKELRNRILSANSKEL